MYHIYIHNLKTYELNKNTILELYKDSYEIASNGWNALLKISDGDGKFKNKEFDIVGGNASQPNDERKKFEELALKYLDPGHTY